MGREASQQQQDAPCGASLCLPRLRLCPRWNDVASCMAGWGWKANRGIDQFLCLLTTNRKGSQLWPERDRHQVMADRPVTNDNNKNLKKDDRCRSGCVKYRNPWAAPGQAPSLGGGCGVFGGNPWGCPAGKDDRPAGSRCGQDEPIGRGMRGTSSFGTDARLFDFPQMITTEWQIGSIQDVVWTSKGGHRGGYTYRLCKMPEGGRSSIEEECFTKNVLKFATNFTMIKAMNWKGEGEWERFDQTDLSEGTYPEGSVWRPVGKYLKGKPTLRKDSVVVPSTLAPGDYVLGWRWDGSGGNQVWVSCASMRLVDAPAGRAADDEDDEEDSPLYTDEEYAELEGAF